MGKFIWGLFFISASCSLQAMNTGNYYQISQVYTWSDYTEGTFLVLLKNPRQSTVDLCAGGFWLDGANDKNATVYSTVLSAYHSNTKVRIYADENQDWSGLSSKNCKLKLVVLEPK
ncbi:MAG: hypothetical protein ACTJIB_03300 [Pseudoalteromonas prydzensis]|uniref:hypothetical protein n=1 Tax=Pseudoalteromonas prydzensis TaxID=182141 RepID=UPI003F962BE5